MAEISATQWQELNPLLDELLDAQSDARAERLAQIRRDDAALAEQPRSCCYGSAQRWTVTPFWRAARSRWRRSPH